MDFNNIDSKLDKLDQRLDETNIILAKQSVILEQHIKRSDTLEQLVELHKESNEKKFKTLYKYVDRAKFLGWVIGALLTMLVGLQQLGIFKL